MIKGFHGHPDLLIASVVHMKGFRGEKDKWQQKFPSPPSSLLVDALSAFSGCQFTTKTILDPSDECRIR